MSAFSSNAFAVAAFSIAAFSFDTTPVTPSGNNVTVSDLSSLFLKQTVGAPSIVVGPTLADLKARRKAEQQDRQQSARLARTHADAESAQFMALQADQIAAKRRRDMTALLAAWMDDE